MTSPNDHSSNCYLKCTGSEDICGGPKTNIGSAFHVQGKRIDSAFCV